MGFQEEDRVQLVLVIPDVDAVRRVESLRDPVQAVERHDVVQAKDARPRQDVAERGPEVPVAVLPDPLWMRGREPPPLAPGEEAIRRRPRGRLQREPIPLTPHVIARRMAPQRQIQAQGGPGPTPLPVHC
jgi:hypothetical protein